MRKPTRLLAGLLLLAAMPSSADALAPRHPTRAQVRLRTFSSCTALVSYARRHFATTHGVPLPGVTTEMPTPSTRSPQAGAPTPTAAPVQSSGTSFSTTNNQELAVDEPDIVKTDGSRIFSVVANRLYAVTVGASGPMLAGSLDLTTSGYGSQLLLRGNRLIVISGGAPSPLLGGVGRGVPGRPVTALAIRSPSILSPYYYGGQTQVTEVDVHDPAAMKITRTMTVDGSFVAARQNGAVARLVISSAPRAIAYPASVASPRAWVPRRQFTSRLTGHRYTRAVAACNAIRRPVQFSGLGMLTILTIDLDQGLYATDSKAIMADAQVVYGSTRSLYVATEKWIDPRTPASQLPASTTTVIDRFDVTATNPASTVYKSSGEVPGYLLNQYSMSESGGYLRVASTSRPIWWNSTPQPPLSQSYVTVLDEQGSVLTPVGQVSGLGAGQSIRSVRFVGDAGYVVTFRQIDPLYTIDLRTPANPRLAGQLELQGYSAYLHPLDDGLLLGIGQDVAPAANEPSGVQVELFDVSQPAAPRLVARTTLGSGSSTEVQYDPHAFLSWPPSKLAVLPVQIYAPSQYAPPAGPPGPVQPQQTGASQNFTGAIGFHLDRSGITELARISNDSPGGYASPIRRSLVIGDRLFTLSDGGLMASDLATLARQSFVAFPQAQVQPQPGVGSVQPASPPRRTKP